MTCLRQHASACRCASRVRAARGQRRDCTRSARQGANPRRYATKSIQRVADVAPQFAATLAIRGRGITARWNLRNSGSAAFLIFHQATRGHLADRAAVFVAIRLFGGLGTFAVSNRVQRLQCRDANFLHRLGFDHELAIAGHDWHVITGAGAFALDGSALGHPSRLLAFFHGRASGIA